MNLDTPPEEPGPLVPKTEEFENAEWRRDDEAEELAAFMVHLHEFMNKRNTPITRMPQLAHKDVDLRLLYILVIKLGGLHEVVKQDSWKQIVKEFNFAKPITNAAYMLRLDYIKYLYAYERHYYFGLPDDGVDHSKPKPKYFDGVEGGFGEGGFPEDAPAVTYEFPKALYQTIPLLPQDFSETAVPEVSSRLHRNNHEGLQMRKVHTLLLSTSPADTSAAIHALLVKSAQKDFQLKMYPHVPELITRLCESLWETHLSDQKGLIPPTSGNATVFNLPNSRDSALDQLLKLLTAIRNFSMLPSNQYTLINGNRQLLELLCAWIQLDAKAPALPAISALGSKLKSEPSTLLSQLRPVGVHSLYYDLSRQSLEIVANLVHHIALQIVEGNRTILEGDDRLSEDGKLIRQCINTILPTLFAGTGDDVEASCVILFAKVASNSSSSSIFESMEEELILRVIHKLALVVVGDQDVISEWAAFGLAHLAQQSMTRSIAVSLCELHHTSILQSLLLLLQRFASYWRMSPEESVAYDRRRFIATNISIFLRKVVHKENREYFLAFEDLFVELSFANGIIGTHMSHVVHALTKN